MPDDNIQEELLKYPEIRSALVFKLTEEAKLFRADALKSDAETAGLAELQRQAKAQADASEILAAQTKRTEDETLATNRYNRQYNFMFSVDDQSVKACIAQLTEWDRLSPEQPFEIVFNSPGGNIVDGLALFDYIRLMRAKGHEVTTSAIGYAASMAGILLQAGDHRIMGRESWLLIHEASFITLGKFGEVLDEVDWIKRIQKRILDIFAERSHMTAKQIEFKWTRRDWWLSSEEALKLGFVDWIR